MDARTQRSLEDLATERGARGFSFDDLAEHVAGTGVGADELVRWLAEGRDSGLLADLGSETLSDGTILGPRRYALAAAAPHAGRVCRRGGEPDTEPGYWVAPEPARYR